MMAFSSSIVPKSPFVTPKKVTLHKTQSIESSPFTTPKTNKTASSVANTPECFNIVTLETPSNKSKRISKDKNAEESNLTVAVRIRPMNSKELACVGATNIVRVRDKELIIKSSAAGNLSMNVDHIFQYDHIFWSCDESNSSYSSQENVFATIGRPLLNSAFRGYNACLFAYGQTGSGKSFSMMGKNTCEAVDIDSHDFSGIIPRFCRDLFDRISALDENSAATVEVSYFEIYNEKIHDLLSVQSPNNKVALRVREHPEWGPYVVDLSVYPVKSYKELRNWLILGNKNRATAATVMNEKSSRSHSIFSIEICLTDNLNLNEGDSSRRSKVSLVDLAGSERLVGQHNTEEKIRQGVSINKSLLTLGKVISALADQKRNQFVPYRDSVLTWLLRECLGGNSLTSMLATITPADTHLDETLATLRYACQARSIVNRARINENPHDRLIRELRSEVQRLKALKQDFERNSFSNSSLTILNDSKDELDELRSKLMHAESKLLSAEEVWKKRFMECAQSQLKELAESEKRREELESKMRVMSNTAETNLDISLYKTNFLEELEDVLTDESNEKSRIEDWCSENNLKCAVSPSGVRIIDNVGKKEIVLSQKDISKCSDYKNISEFIGNFEWTDANKAQERLSKREIMSSLNQIYNVLNKLKPVESDNNLNLLFAKVNKSLQSFETALLNNVSKSSGQKSVTFNL